MKRSFLPLLLLAAALLAGCDKADEGLLICEPPAPSVPSLGYFYRLYAPAVQVAEVNANQTQTVKLLDGSSIEVPAGSFELPSGAPVSGTVEVRAQVVGTTAQMVLSSVPSSSFWLPLQAGGHIRITARQGANALRLRSGRYLTVSTLAPTNSDAFQNAMRGIGTGSAGVSVAWIDDTVLVRTITNGAGERFFQRRVWTDSLGWFSLSRAWSANDTTQLRADVGGEAGTRIFLLPTQRSAAFLMKWNSLTRLMEVYGVTPNTELNVVSMRYQNGQLFAGAQRVTTRRGLVMRPVLQPVTPEQAAALIRRQ